VPETAGFGGEGADAGRDGEGASGGFAAAANPGGNLGVGGAANDGVAACPVGVGSNPGGNLGVLAGEGGKLGMGVLALRGGVPSGCDVAGLDGLGALGEGVFCPLPDIVGAWLRLAFVTWWCLQPSCPQKLSSSTTTVRLEGTKEKGK
jgi:hypothetical protein